MELNGKLYNKKKDRYISGMVWLKDNIYVYM